MSEDEAATKIVSFWVDTPWRSWGTVTGTTREEARQKAEADREHMIARLEDEIAYVRVMPFEIESNEDD